MQQHRLIDDFHALLAAWTTINDIAEEYEGWCTTGSFFSYRCEERTKEIISAVDITDCVRQVHAEGCPFLGKLPVRRMSSLQLDESRLCRPKSAAPVE